MGNQQQQQEMENDNNNPLMILLHQLLSLSPLLAPLLHQLLLLRPALGLLLHSRTLLLLLRTMELLLLRVMELRTILADLREVRAAGTEVLSIRTSTLLCPRLLWRGSVSSRPCSPGHSAWSSP